MNAVDFLLEEHEGHRYLLRELEKGADRFQDLRSEIIHHVNMEEAILFPNLLKISSLEIITREAWEDHNICMQLLQELDNLQKTSKEWKSKFNVLKKYLLLHFEEEEGKLFPKIRELASEEFLEEVGKQMVIQKLSTSSEKILYPESPGSHKIV